MKIIGIIGDRGSGKTALMTHLLKIDNEQFHRDVFSNYWLNFIPDENYITFEEMASLPDYLRNCSVGADEIHMWGDARKFLSAKNAGLTALITQIRKLGINLYYTTQRFRYVDNRLRDQSDYLIFPEPVKPFMHNGVLIKNLFRFTVQKVVTGEVVRVGYFDANRMFKEKWYDTNEVIEYDQRRINNESNDEQ